MSKLLFFDSETTGLDYRNNCMIELGYIIDIGNKTVEEGDMLIKPHPKAKIEPTALSKNGHKMEEITGYPDQAEVFKNFLAMLDQYVDRYDRTDKFHLVGYNNRAFDDKFLRMWFNLNDNKFFGSYFWSDSIDVMSLASHMLIPVRAGMPSFKLHRVAKTLGLRVDDASLHGAVYDAGLTREIYYKLFPKTLL